MVDFGSHLVVVAALLLLLLLFGGLPVEVHLAFAFYSVESPAAVVGIMQLLQNSPRHELATDMFCLKPRILYLVSE